MDEQYDPKDFPIGAEVKLIREGSWADKVFDDLFEGGIEFYVSSHNADFIFIRIKDEVTAAKILAGGAEWYICPCYWPAKCVSPRYSCHDCGTIWEGKIHYLCKRCRALQ